MLANVTAVAQEDRANSSAQDLAYGVTLYHYYQQQYLHALTELTAAQQLRRLPNHAQEAELLRGGISLSYGLDREARSVFETLLAEPGEEGDAVGRVDKDRAWFYLAKLNWRQGAIPDSREALARMATDYSGAHADEANYLRAIQFLQAEDEFNAVQQLQQLAQPCPFKPYYFYNLGVQHAAAARWSDAAEAYLQVDELNCNSPEGDNLRDRANVAQGFSQLAAGNTVAARNAFKQVRLSGPESDRALLGYGWSYAHMGDHDGALTPWLTLGERELGSASARESLLAIPYAYEQLGQTVTAIQQYSEAATRFAHRRSDVELMTAEVQDGDLLQLFGLEALADLAWLGGSDPMPQADAGAFLTELLAADAVQLALREYRDLHQLNTTLDRARERLAVLTQVDIEQRRVWEETASGGRAETLIAQQQQLEEQTRSLRERLDQAIAVEDLRALAGPQQLARWQRLERANRLARQLGDESKLEQLRLMHGLMRWQDNENFADRRWQLQQQMRELEALTQQSAGAEEALRDALTTRQRPVYAQRIQTMRNRLDERQASVSSALMLAENQLRQRALDELETQRRLLARGEAQARLAVARLYDEASPEVPR